MRVGAWVVSGLLVSAMAFGQTQEGIALTRFNKGRDLFATGQFASALVEFRASAGLADSPTTWLYVARCERELGHLAAAYVDYQRAVSAAEEGPDRRYATVWTTATKEASAVERKLGYITVVAPNLPEGATITVNGSPLAAAAIGVKGPVEPGPIDVLAKATGYTTVHKNTDVNAGESVEVQIKLEKAAPEATTETTTDTNTSTSETSREQGTTGPNHLVRDAGFVVGGIGLGSFAVCAAFGALTLARFNQLQSQCDGHCSPSYIGQINQGETFQAAANVAFFVGSAAVVAGTIMVIVGWSGKPAAAVQSAWSGGVTPMPGGGWVAGVARRF
jgi:hypothetical protein